MIPFPSEAQKLYRQGWTCDQIAKKYGVSREYVRQGLVDRGVGIRSRSERQTGERNGMYGKSHTAETKEKLRDAHTRQYSNPQHRLRASRRMTEKIASGKIRRQSRLEELVKGVLEKYHVHYQYQVVMADPETSRRCCVDFLVEDSTVLEVNGTFWHADPRVYPNGPIHATQKRVAEAYAFKCGVLKKLGLKLAEVWEMDLKGDPEAAIMRALGLQ